MVKQLLLLTQEEKERKEQEEQRKKQDEDAKKKKVLTNMSQQYTAGQRVSRQSVVKTHEDSKPFEQKALANKSHYHLKGSVYSSFWLIKM